MDVLKRLQYLLNKRGWTMYRLAKESGLSDKTIANIYRRGTMPSIPTLESICSAFGMTMNKGFISSAFVLVLAGALMIAMSPDVVSDIHIPLLPF